jgi:molybdenum cofactor biosynthesis protein B
MSASSEFIPVNIAVLTVSDTRTVETDTSGQLLVDSLQAAGHQLADRALMKDDIYQVRAIISKWIASADVEAILITGGTGFSGRDTTPEAVIPLFDKQIEGYGELFRQISLNDIGTSTVQSRAVGGLANNTVIFCMPGSTNACRTAWDKILGEQLDARTRPCNFIPHVAVADQCESRT